MTEIIKHCYVSVTIPSLDSCFRKNDSDGAIALRPMDAPSLSAP